MKKFSADAHWRDSARSVRFFIWDFQAAFPLLLFLLYMRVWTLIAALVATLFFTILNHFGFSVPVFGRLLRNSLAGSRKQSVPWWLS